MAPHRARPPTEVLGTLSVRGVARDAQRLGLVVTRGREVEPLAPGIWAVPDWRLFGPADSTWRQALGHKGHRSHLRNIGSIAPSKPSRYAASGSRVRMAKIMISLPDGFLKKVDRTAKAQGRSRSELIREALRGALTGQERGRRPWNEALAPLRDLDYRETRYGREARR